MANLTDGMTEITKGKKYHVIMRSDFTVYNSQTGENHFDDLLESIGIDPTTEIDSLEILITHYNVD